jgi:hypothetical protein
VAEWVEVWGRETPTAARERLYRFPAVVWTDAFRDEFLLMADGQGVTDVEVRRVRDDEAEVGAEVGAIGEPKVCRCGHLSTQHRLVIDPGGARRGCILCGCLQFRDDGKAGGAAMTPVWLYDADGRQLYYVYVPASLPPVVTYASRMFRWETARQRYEEVPDPVPCFLVGPEGASEK